MSVVFLNGPVQNGAFTLEDRPGKAVGIRIAAALNTILGTPPVPHLWNTVTLDGDLRHRRSPAQIHRRRFEAELISAKYGPASLPPGGILTDADAEVADLAMTMLERRLRLGVLKIVDETVQTCRSCGHMVGSGRHACNACGALESRARTEPHLVSDRQDSHSAVDRLDIHSSHPRQPRHLQSTAGNGPARLILSRTRDYGVDLSPLGLPGLALDPRVGIHITVLAAARRLRAETAVMTTTQNAANHVAAHGTHFREHGGTRLKYAIHGHAPYDNLATIMQPTYAAYGSDTAARTAFETWFLPLLTLKEKTKVRTEQLPAYFKYYARSRMARPASLQHVAVHAVRQAVTAGDPDWLMVKTKLANAMLLGDGPA